MLLKMLRQNIVVCKAALALSSTQFDLSGSASAATVTIGFDPQSLALCRTSALAPLIVGNCQYCNASVFRLGMMNQDRHDESLTCDSGGGLVMGAAIRFAVIPGKGLRLPDAPGVSPPGNLKASLLYTEEPMNGAPCACGAGDAAGDRNRAFRLPDLALCGATAGSGAVAGRESALIGRSPCILPLAACERCRDHVRQRQILRLKIKQCCSTSLHTPLHCQYRHCLGLCTFVQAGLLLV